MVGTPICVIASGVEVTILEQIDMNMNLNMNMNKSVFLWSESKTALRYFCSTSINFVPYVM